MPASLRDIILQVKENADIVQVIGQYVPLKRAGARWLGLCPFHHDRSPSLNVTPQMGIYKCFACGAGGDVLKFVQEYEKLDFIDALRTVAGRAGIAIPEHIASSRDDGDRGKAAEVLAANQLACRLYQEELEAHPSTLAYLEGRGVSQEARRHFQLGYAPPSPEKILKRAAAKGVSRDALVEAGILGITEGGRVYDRFGGRLVFPIWNLSGHVIGFGGRVLEAGAQPKYVNSPESPFYHKSKVLYGLNFARNEMDKTGEAVLVEGYMDLLSLWQAGIRNAVAVSGTALTKEHVHILARFARKAVLYFDGDAAGRKAVRRSLEPLLAAGMEVRVPLLPPEEDPDSFARKYGAERVRETFAAGEGLVGFFIREIGKPVDAISIEEREKNFHEFMGLVQLIPSQRIRDQYYHELGKKLGVSAIKLSSRNLTEKALIDGTFLKGREASSSIEPSVAPGVVPPIPGIIAKDESVPEWQLLQILLSSEAMCRASLDALSLDWLRHPAVRSLADHLLAFVEESGGLDLRGFQERLSAADRDIVAAVGLLDFSDEERLARQLFDTLEKLEIRYLKRRMAMETDVAKAAGIQKRIRELQSKGKGGTP